MKGHRDIPSSSESSKSEKSNFNLLRTMSNLLPQESKYIQLPQQEIQEETGSKDRLSQEMQEKTTSTSEEKQAFFKKFVGFAARDTKNLEIKRQLLSFLSSKDEAYFRNGNKKLSHEELVEKIMKDLKGPKEKELLYEFGYGEKNKIIKGTREFKLGGDYLQAGFGYGFDTTKWRKSVIRQIPDFLEVCENYIRSNNLEDSDRFQNIRYSDYEKTVLYPAALKNDDRDFQNMLIGKARYSYECIRELFTKKGLPPIKPWPDGEKSTTSEDYPYILKNATNTINKARKGKDPID